VDSLLDFQVTYTTSVSCSSGQSLSDDAVIVLGRYSASADSSCGEDFGTFTKRIKGIVHYWAEDKASAIDYSKTANVKDSIVDSLPNLVLLTLHSWSSSPTRTTMAQCERQSVPSNCSSWSMLNTIVQTPQRQLMAINGRCLGL
jgi:hypothetical protein